MGCTVILQELDDFIERCTAAALNAGADAHMLEDLPAFTAHQRAQHIKRLTELRCTMLAALYGCAPSAIERAGLVSMGEYRHDRIDKQPRHAHHALRSDWLTVEMQSFADTRALNIELRGLSRAIWLALLWTGGDVMPFERSRWYHWSDVSDYWPLAWSCTYGCPPESQAHYRRELLNYGQRLSSEYTRRHKAGKTHAAARYILDAGLQWGLYE